MRLKTTSPARDKKRATLDLASNQGLARELRLPAKYAPPLHSSAADADSRDIGIPGGV
jgi:hypothetical protein